MRILLWHGYLLTGSGSNIYTANVAREWRDAGHDVVVMCQDKTAAALPFVDDAFDLDVSVAPVAARAGSCRVARPFIDSLLPVYVYDDYEGFEVKRFVELTEDELERYTTLNVDAMIQVIRSFEPHAIITGHEVMGPYIALRACDRTKTRYIAKLHGSALEYAVKRQERYQRFAVEGLGGATRVVGGSAYMVREAASVIPGWEQCGAVVNPGCDVDLFRPPSEPRVDPPIVSFVGKMIAAKGVHNLVAALGLVERRDMRVVLVGYGGFETRLRNLVASLMSRDLSAVEEIARTGEHGPLVHLQRFIDEGGIDEGYLDRIAALDVDFTGRLEHGPLSRLLPTIDVLVVPSVVPEAFGMVAAEAAACGVLPIVPDHSGIAEAGAAIEEAIGAPGLLTFRASDPIRSIAAAIDRVLLIPREEREEMGRVAAALARERWSWSRVAESLLGHAVARSDD
ncbi:MAG: glycosyltransferase family 4 protein [Actinobacteria bacterium]|nr:glycosyltransferase family 4 protein [Actinomycetota bacterium]